MRYVIDVSSGSNYVRVKRTFFGRVNGPSVYNVKNLPEWMRTGMVMLDMAFDPATGYVHIEDYGGKLKTKYIFYEEGGRCADYGD